MASQSALRKAMLREVYRRSAGNLYAIVDLNEVAKSLGLSRADATIVALQLGAKNWVTFSQNFEGGDMSPTIIGIEEAERMEKPLLKRWPSEHPVFFGFLMSLLAVTVSKLLDLAIKHFAGQ